MAVFSIQNPVARVSPYFVLGDQPHSLNKVYYFNHKINQSCLDFYDGNGCAHLVSVAADGVGYDIKFIRWTLIKFLRSKIYYMDLVESNKNAKKILYQFIVGSCIVVLVIHMVDPHLFMLDDISKDIWRVNTGPWVVFFSLWLLAARYQKLQASEEAKMKDPLHLCVSYYTSLV